MHENDWENHPLYKLQVLEEQEEAIANMIYLQWRCSSKCKVEKCI